MDALHEGNLLRFVNDPRGTGHTANLWAKPCAVPVHGMQLHTVSFITTRAIQAGEELLIDYGGTYVDGWSTLARPWLSDPDTVVELADAPPVRVKREHEDYVEVEVDDTSDVVVEYTRPSQWALKAELEECQVLLDVLKASTQFSHGYDEVKIALQLHALSVLKRKHQRGILREEAEVSLFEDLRTSYDPGKPILCKGPCGRRLKRSCFGPIQVHYFGWEWPPCLVCCK